MKKHIRRTKRELHFFARLKAKITDFYERQEKTSISLRGSMAKTPSLRGSPYHLNESSNCLGRGELVFFFATTTIFFSLLLPARPPFSRCGRGAIVVKFGTANPFLVRSAKRSLFVDVRR